MQSDYTSGAWFLAVLGCVLSWWGWGLYRRPLESAERAREAMRRGRPPPEWYRDIEAAFPVAKSRVLRTFGILLLLFGSMLVLLGGRGLLSQ